MKTTCCDCCGDCIARPTTLGHEKYEREKPCVTKPYITQSWGICTKCDAAGCAVLYDNSVIRHCTPRTISEENQAAIAQAFARKHDTGCACNDCEYGRALLLVRSAP